MLNYIGKGAFLIGVPARDLSADEVRLYGGEEMLLSTGLYEKANDKPARSGKKAQADVAEQEGE